MLEWILDTQGYTVTQLDTVGASDDELEQRIDDYLTEHPASTTRQVQANVKGTTAGSRHAWTPNSTLRRGQTGRIYGFRARVQVQRTATRRRTWEKTPMNTEDECVVGASCKRDFQSECVGASTLRETHSLPTHTHTAPRDQSNHPVEEIVWAQPRVARWGRPMATSRTPRIIHAAFTHPAVCRGFVAGRGVDIR